MSGMPDDSSTALSAGAPSELRIEREPVYASTRSGSRWREVIIEGDDLGLLYAFNEGIYRAHRQGVLTSASLRANGFAYEHAIREVLPACPDLGVGVHLCLNEAAPVAPRDRVRLLLGRDGMLRPGYLWVMRLSRTAAGREQIECELRAQIEKALGDGVRVDHLNSHHHTHMIPDVFRIACRLGREYGISWVRLAREPRHRARGLGNQVGPLANANYVKHVLLNRFARRNAHVVRESGLRTTDHFVGVMYTGQMNLDRIAAGLAAAGRGCLEVLMHPAVGPDPRDAGHTSAFYRKYVPSRARAVELETLTDDAMASWLRREGWARTTFGTLGQGSRSCARGDDARGSGAGPGPASRAVVIQNPPWVSAAHDDARAFADVVLERARPGQRVLDLGTGTGILAITLAKAGIEVVATDVSAAAVRNARENAARNGVNLECYRSDLLDLVQGRFDMIAFNPPYNVRPDSFLSNVAKNLVRRISWVQRNCGVVMPKAVLRFHQQLVRRLADKAPRHLNPGGGVVLHAFAAEVGALREVLPEKFEVQVIDHPLLWSYGTVAMLVFPSH